MSAHPPESELRAMIREALRDLLPTPEAERVFIRTDAELAAFVQRLLGLFDSEATRAQLRSGRLKFHLETSGAPVGLPTAGAPAVHRIERGAVTERHVKAAEAAGARLVLGRKAVLTPLARDRARSCGLTIEKEH